MSTITVTVEQIFFEENRSCVTHGMIDSKHLADVNPTVNPSSFIFIFCSKTIKEINLFYCFSNSFFLLLSFWMLLFT